MGVPKLESALSVVKRNHLTKTIIRWLNYSNTDIHTTVMSAINQNQEIDTLTVTENADGTFEINWDKEDPNWSFMNNLTSNQIQVMIQEAIQDRLNQNDA